MPGRVEEPVADPVRRRPVWPATVALVVLAAAVTAWDLYGAVISTAPFFGELPTRGDYLEAAGLCLAAAAAALALGVAAAIVGSRWGLVFFAVFAVVGLVAAVAGLQGVGPVDDPHRTRALQAGDVFTDLNLPSGLAVGLAAVIAVVVPVWRRRRQA